MTTRPIHFNYHDDTLVIPAPSDVIKCVRIRKPPLDSQEGLEFISEEMFSFHGAREKLLFSQLTCK